MTAVLGTATIPLRKYLPWIPSNYMRALRQSHESATAVSEGQRTPTSARKHKSKIYEYQQTILKFIISPLIQSCALSHNSSFMISPLFQSCALSHNPESFRLPLPRRSCLHHARLWSLNPCTPILILHCKNQHRTEFTTLSTSHSTVCCLTNLMRVWQ